LKEDFEIDDNRINEDIKATPVRVVTDEGEQLGIIPTAEALARAQDEGLDLVEVAPTSDPPVCRIMDFGKHKYAQSKRAHKNPGHKSKLKEIRVRPKTGAHDIDFKVKRAKQFLANKDKVQITVIFRGREMAHIDEGRRVVESILAEIEDVAKVESPPRQAGRRMTCTVAPK
jgi:translation initiation factor IF-3